MLAMGRWLRGGCGGEGRGVRQIDSVGSRYRDKDVSFGWHRNSGSGADWIAMERRTQNNFCSLPCVLRNVLRRKAFHLSHFSTQFV